MQIDAAKEEPSLENIVDMMMTEGTIEAHIFLLAKRIMFQRILARRAGAHNFFRRILYRPARIMFRRMLE